MVPWWSQAVTISMLVWLCCYHRVAAVFSDNFACGVHNVNVKTVAGGTDVQPNEIAWQAYLEITMPDQIELNHCGGVLVDDDVVLTAAHCADKATKIEVILGEHDLSEPDETQVWRAVAKHVHIHPEYGKRTPEDLDVAVIIMDRRVIWDQYPYIIPICFHPQQQQTPIVNLTAVVSGWGQLQNGSSSHILQKAELTIQPQEVCTYAYKKSFTENMLCAKTSDGKVTACAGDSGGPLAIKSPLGSNYILVGLVNFGKQCGRQNFPSVFAKTSAIYDWFEKVTSDKSLPPATSSLEIRKWTNTSICAAEGKDDEIDKVCGSSDRNLLGFFTDGSEPDECRARCASTTDCNFFTWKRYVASLNLSTSCTLYRGCPTRVSCAKECQTSLTGYRDPPFQSACCELFHHGLRCTVHDEHLLRLTTNVPNMARCQKDCQATESCEYFNYDDKSQRCLLLAECGTQIACNDNCWSGPRLPSLDSCLPRANVSTGNTQMVVLLLGAKENQSEKIPCGDCTSGPKCPDMDTCSGSGKQAAVLLGGIRYMREVEAWPCSSASIPDLPQARENQPAAAIMSDGNLYLCGGSVSGLGITDTCDIYNKTAGTWVQGGLGLKMTEKRALMPTIMVDKWAVAAGGYNSNGWLNSWEYLEISRLGAAWIKGSFQLKRPRMNHCGVAISSTSFVVVGGYNGQILKSLEKYSMTTGFVGNLPDLPVARDGHACTLTDDSAQLIVAGGYNGIYLSSVISLDLAKLTWTTLPSMIRIRYGLTLGIFYGKLTAFGGYGGENTLEVYNGTSWAETNLTSPRSYHSMVKTVC